MKKKRDEISEKLAQPTQQHIWFSGRVQGVGFRASLRSKARALGLSGWVSNLWDGRVEAVLAGPQTDVELLVKWCLNGGIPFAQVSGIQVEEEPISETEDFNVR